MRKKIFFQNKILFLIIYLGYKAVYEHFEASRLDFQAEFEVLGRLKRIKIDDLTLEINDRDQIKLYDFILKKKMISNSKRGKNKYLAVQRYDESK